LKKFCALALPLLLASSAWGAPPAPAFDHSIPKYFDDLDDVTAMARYESQVRQALLDRQFDRLEAEHAYCLASQEQFPDGDPYLFHYYETFGQDGDLRFRSRSDIEELEKRSQEWVVRSPSSVAAWMVRFEFSTTYARVLSRVYPGAGPEERELSSQGFQLGLRNRREALIKAAALDAQAEAHDPQVPINLLGVASYFPGADLPPRAECLKAEEAEAWYPIARRNLAWYASPWNDASEEDFARYLKGLLKEGGPEFYFEAAAWMARPQKDDLFSRMHWDFGLIQKGYAMKMKRNPSLALEGRMAYIAASAEKQEPAQELFARLGRHFEGDYFLDNMGEIYAARYLRVAGIDPGDLDNLSRVAHNGEREGTMDRIREWYSLGLHPVREATAVLSPRTAVAEAYLDALPTLPLEARNKVLSAFECPYCPSKDPDMPGLGEARQRFVATVDVKPWLARAVARIKAAPADDPSAELLGCLIRSLDGRMVEGLPEIFELLGTHQWPQTAESLGPWIIAGNVVGAATQAQALVRRGDPAVSDALLSILEHATKGQPYALPRQGHALRLLLQSGTPEEKLRARALLAAMPVGTTDQDAP
jgi:hypothetical protein